MNWTELLKSEIESSYAATDGLLALLEDGDLDWKPATGTNWMTAGQLAEHVTSACGGTVRGFVTGDWGIPPEEMADLPADEMLPPAEKLPSATSVAAVRRALAEDKTLALRTIDEAGEKRLASEETTAPWDPTPMILGHRLLHMIGHLGNHESQLFYYLKLMGKPVNTMHLYGMGASTSA